MATRESPYFKCAFFIFLLLSPNAIDCARVVQEAEAANRQGGTHQVSRAGVADDIGQSQEPTSAWEETMAAEAEDDTDQVEEEFRESTHIDSLIAEAVLEESAPEKAPTPTPASGEAVDGHPNRTRIRSTTGIATQLANQSRLEVAQRLVRNANAGNAQTGSKIAMALRSAEDPEALALRYIRQVDRLERLQSGSAHKVCVSGDPCSLEVPHAGALSYTLEAALPCTGEGDALEFNMRPSSWSSPREGRGCPEDAKLRTLSAQTLAVCQAACFSTSECTAVAFHPSTQTCDTCSHASGLTLPRARAEVYRIQRQVEVLVPAHQAGRQLVCAVESEDVRIAGWVDVRAVRAGQHAACFEGGDCEVRIEVSEPPAGSVLVLTRIAQAAHDTDGSSGQRVADDEGCVGNGTRVVHRASLQSMDTKTLRASVDSSVLGEAPVLRMCYCPGGDCSPANSQGIGFLRTLPGCGEAFESFAASLMEAHSTCVEVVGSDAVNGAGDCDALREQPQCLLSVDALLFHPARRFNVESQQLLGQPVRNCWAWAREHQEVPVVRSWKDAHPEVWAFAEMWGSDCGRQVSRTSICGAFAEGNVARQFRESWGADADDLSEGWVSNLIDRMGTSLWSAQRSAGDALNFARNLAEPQTYSGEAGRLSCPPGMYISQISFASYGNPSMRCGEMTTGTCNAGVRVVEDVEAACLWANECQVRPFTANGTSRWPLEGSGCEEVENLRPVLAMEATCVQATENSIQDIVGAHDDMNRLVDRLGLDVGQGVEEEVAQVGSARAPYQDVVDNFCSDCGTLLANVETLPEAVCPTDGRMRVHSESMCRAAETVGESSELVTGYMGDVQTALGSSFFGHRAARNEVCKDLHLCGYNSNLVAAGIASGMGPIGSSASAETLRDLRSEILGAYRQTPEDATEPGPDQAGICASCEAYHVPELLELEVWDYDALSEDEYLGSVYVDIEAELAHLSASNTYNHSDSTSMRGETLKRHVGRGSGYNQSGMLRFSWEATPSQLTVSVFGAQFIAGRDVGSQSDAYVKVRYGSSDGCLATASNCQAQTNELGQVQTTMSTQRITNDMNPTWNVRLVFQRGHAREASGREASVLGAALATTNSRGAFVALRHAFGRRQACMHVGLCEYSSNIQRRLGFLFGGSGAAILREVSMRGHIDRRYDEIMTQLNTYPCRSTFTPKNLLLTFTTWRNLQYITQTLFRMRQSVDEAYLLYVRGRNQQVMRGLFHSDVMSNVPSYLRGILEGAVSGMLEGRPVSKAELFSSLAVAFKRFALGSIGRVLVSPVYIVTSLVNLVMTGGRVVLHDFLYNFLFRGLREGRSISDLLRDAGSWIRRSGRRAYSSARDAAFGTDNCPNTADGPPAFVTGAAARQLFTVGEQSGHGSLLEVAETDGSASLSELGTKRYSGASGVMCNGVQLTGQQYGLLDAADGLSLHELRTENSYAYDYWCEVRYSDIYVCGTNYDFSPPEPVYCENVWYEEEPCVLTGYFFGGYDDMDGSNLFRYNALGGQSWALGGEWHSTTIFNLANSNPDATACDLHQMLVEEGQVEAQRLQERYEYALMVMMYIAMTIYVLTYLACVHSTIPSTEMLASGQYGVGSVARSTLSCTLWPFTWNSLLRERYPNRVPPRRVARTVVPGSSLDDYYGGGGGGGGGGIVYHGAGPVVSRTRNRVRSNGRHHGRPAGQNSGRSVGRMGGMGGMGGMGHMGRMGRMGGMSRMGRMGSMGRMGRMGD